MPVTCSDKPSIHVPHPSLLHPNLWPSPLFIKNAGLGRLLAAQVPWGKKLKREARPVLGGSRNTVNDVARQTPPAGEACRRDREAKNTRASTGPAVAPSTRIRLPCASAKNIAKPIPAFLPTSICLSCLQQASASSRLVTSFQSYNFLLATTSSTAGQDHNAAHSKHEELAFELRQCPLANTEINE